MKTSNSNKKDQTPTGHKNDADDETCYFFKLPLELREEIYKLCLDTCSAGGALVNIGRDECNQQDSFTGVVINKPPHDRHVLPPLLHTCRLVRSEAARVWFNRNRFFIFVHSLDARLLYQWTKFCRALVPPPAKPAHGSAHNPRLEVYSAFHAYDWANVLQWCRWIHQGELEVPQERPYYQGQHLATGALQIAHSHRGRSWEECESSLAGLRMALEGCFKKVTIR